MGNSVSITGRRRGGPALESAKVKLRELVKEVLHDDRHPLDRSKAKGDGPRSEK